MKFRFKKYDIFYIQVHKIFIYVLKLGEHWYQYYERIFYSDSYYNNQASVNYGSHFDIDKSFASRHLNIYHTGLATIYGVTFDLNSYTCNTYWVNLKFRPVRVTRRIELDDVITYILYHKNLFIIYGIYPNKLLF